MSGEQAPGDDRALATGRNIAAPPAAVFDAIRDPARLARWWGPAGFSNQFTVFEFHPGGRWQHVMQGPDGTRYPNEAVFEVVDPSRVVIRHLEPAFRLTISLAASSGGTQVGWLQVFDDARVCRQLAPMCIPANDQNLDRLQAELAHGH